MDYEHTNERMKQMYPRHKYVHKKIPTYLGYDIERSASPETGAMLTKSVKPGEKTAYERKTKQKTPISVPLC